MDADDRLRLAAFVVLRDEKRMLVFGDACRTRARELPVYRFWPFWLDGFSISSVLSIG